MNRLLKTIKNSISLAIGILFAWPALLLMTIYVERQIKKNGIYQPKR